jgi:DNA invertase Pin-like site-specific DNA recombinase
VSKEIKYAISYSRKSTKVKDKSIEESVSYQSHAINEYAVRNGFTIIKDFNDVGYSGKNTERPELKDMLTFLETTENRIHELIIYSIDRFGRDMQNNIKMMMDILELVDRVYVVSQSFSSDTRYFKLLFLALTSSAQDERERILARCSGGRMAKVLNRRSFDGNFPALGLIKKEDNEKLLIASSTNVVDLGKDEVLIIKYIYYLYLFNISLRKIASILNRKFGKTKRNKDWSYKSVKYILENPVYTGALKGCLEGINHYFVDNANVEQLIDPSTFIFVQRKLAFEKRGRKTKNRYRNPFFNLCYHCGSYLEEKEDLLRCKMCDVSVEFNMIKNLIVNEMYKWVSIEKKKYHIQKQLVEISDRKKESLRTIKIELNKLNQRREEINQLFSEGVNKNNMLAINTIETSKFIQKKIELEMTIQYLENPDLNKLNENMNIKMKEMLILTPFLILINFKEKEVILLPHAQLLSEVSA